MAIFNNTPQATKNLIIINVLVFVATMINHELIVEKFALFYPLSHSFKPWQPVTYMFVHDGFWHIFFNMYSLWLFGSVVENTIGEKKYLFLYFVCGLGAAGLHLLVQHLMGGSDVSCVGASGAIYGLMMAFAMLYPEQRLMLLFPPVSLSAKWMVVIFAAIELLTGYMSAGGSFSDGVAHFAHLGGMLISFLLIYFWRKSGKLWKR